MIKPEYLNAIINTIKHIDNMATLSAYFDWIHTEVNQDRMELDSQQFELLSETTKAARTRVYKLTNDPG